MFYLHLQSYSTLRKYIGQAGAELGQAQPKLRLRLAMWKFSTVMKINHWDENSSLCWIFINVMKIYHCDRYSSI